LAFFKHKPSIRNLSLKPETAFIKNLFFEIPKSNIYHKSRKPETLKPETGNRFFYV